MMHQLRTKLPHYLETELAQLLNGPDGFSVLDDVLLDGIWYWDLENPDDEYMSPGFWKTLGFDPAEKRHLAKEWMSLILPDDCAKAQAKVQKHIENPRVPYDQVVQYRSKSGEPITVRCRGVAFLKDGKPHRMLGTHVLVTDLKKSAIEQRVDQMMQLSGDAIVSWTEATGVETWNRGATEAYGKTASDAIGKSPFDVSGAILPEPWETIKAHLDTGQDWLGEIPHELPDRPDIITTTRISAVKLDDGRTLYLKISRDETERLEAQRRNTILLNELRHRVRNLFAVVQSVTRLSARPAKTVTGFVESLTGRIAALSAAHTASMGDEHIGPAPLSEVIRGVLEPYRGEALTLDAPSKDIIISEDALTPLSLLINELATNAAKHGGWSTPEGHVHLTWRNIDVAGKATVKLDWNERTPEQGPLVRRDTERTHHGFGTLLIENSAKQLGGTFERSHIGNKLCITLTFRP